MSAQLNAAFYCFTPLEDPEGLAQRWREAFARLELKGTLILASEGLNGFLAGPPPAVRAALEDLRTLPGLADMRVKESLSDSLPFEKLCVKVKPEIVTFRQGTVSGPARRLSPALLARWLAEGRDFVLVDTRNTYESALGSFRGAVKPEIDRFVDFPAAVDAFPAEWKTKPVVTFCTGGIRCEKAAPWMASRGFTEVYQLEGGILGYFEETGGEGWEGECFVFDQRVALGPDLLPTGARLCGQCQGPVPAAEDFCIHCGAGEALP